MRRLWIGLAVVLSLWTARGDALAQVSIPGAEGILALCDSEDQRSQSFCAGYLSGIIHFLALTPSRLAPRGLCLPPNAGDITIRRIYDLVVEEIRTQPDSAKLSAIQAVAIAMSKAYPCAGASARSGNAPAQSTPAPSQPAAPKAAPKAAAPAKKSDFPE